MCICCDAETKRLWCRAILVDPYLLQFCPLCIDFSIVPLLWWSAPMMGVGRSQCSTDRSNPWGIWLVMLCAWIGATDLWEQYPMPVACGFDVPVVFWRMCRDYYTMPFCCGRSFRFLGTECRRPGAKTVVMDFQWYDVVRVVRTTVAGIAVSLLASFDGFVYVFCNVFSGRVTGFFTSIYEACIARQYGLT